MDQKTLNAAIAGDSHATLLRNFLAPDIRFAFSVTAPAKHFFGQFHEITDGQLAIVPDHVKTQFPKLDDQKRDAMERARVKLNEQLQPVIAARAPVVSTLGSATYRFCRLHAAAHSNDPNQPGKLSKKVIRSILQDHCQYYISFHAALVQACDSVTFIIGPSRYPPLQKDLWLAYDAYMQAELQAVGVNVIDIRPETCDAALHLLPAYEADDILHANDAWYEILCDKLGPQLDSFATVA